MSRFKGATSRRAAVSRPAPLPAGSPASLGSERSTSWVFPPTAPGKLTQMSATAQLATERLSEAANTFLFSVFCVFFFQFSAKISPGFQVPWWLWPGEGGGQGSVAGEDVTGSLV